MRFHRAIAEEFSKRLLVIRKHGGFLWFSPARISLTLWSFPEDFIKHIMLWVVRTIVILQNVNTKEARRKCRSKYSRTFAYSGVISEKGEYEGDKVGEKWTKFFICINPSKFQASASRRVANEAKMQTILWNVDNVYGSHKYGECSLHKLTHQHARPTCFVIEKKNSFA